MKKFSRIGFWLYLLRLASPPRVTYFQSQAPEACASAAVRPGELARHSRGEPGYCSDTRWLAITMHREDGTVRKHIPLDPDFVQKSTSPEPDPKKVLTATLTVPKTRGKGSRRKLPRKENMVSTHCSSPIWLLFFQISLKHLTMWRHC